MTSTGISWPQTWRSCWQLALGTFPPPCPRSHPRALRCHHPCWSERKHLLSNQPLAAGADSMALLQGLSVSLPRAAQVYGAVATHRQIQVTHTGTTARDVTQHTVSENTHRHQLNVRFFLCSCQFHFTDSRAGFPHPHFCFQTSFSGSLYYRHPISACSTNYIQPCNNPPHLSKASLQSECNFQNSYRRTKTWVTATTSIGDTSTIFAVSKQASVKKSTRSWLNFPASPIPNTLWYFLHSCTSGAAPLDVRAVFIHSIKVLVAKWTQEWGSNPCTIN